jgi:hypothetical protein
MSHFCPSPSAIAATSILEARCEAADRLCRPFRFSRTTKRRARAQTTRAAYTTARGAVPATISSRKASGEGSLDERPESPGTFSQKDAGRKRNQSGQRDEGEQADRHEERYSRVQAREEGHDEQAHQAGPPRKEQEDTRPLEDEDSDRQRGQDPGVHDEAGRQGLPKKLYCRLAAMALPWSQCAFDLKAAEKT